MRYDLSPHADRCAHLMGRLLCALRRLDPDTLHPDQIAVLRADADEAHGIVCDHLAGYDTDGCVPDALAAILCGLRADPDYYAGDDLADVEAMIENTLIAIGARVPVVGEVVS